MNAFQVKASILSDDKVEFSEFNVLPKPQEMFDSSCWAINDYIAFMNPDNKKWYVSQLVVIDEVGEEEREFIVMLLSPDGESGLLQGISLP